MGSPAYVGVNIGVATVFGVLGLVAAIDGVVVGVYIGVVMYYCYLGRVIDPY